MGSHRAPSAQPEGLPTPPPIPPADGAEVAGNRRGRTRTGVLIPTPQYPLDPPRWPSSTRCRWTTTWRRSVPGHSDVAELRRALRQARDHCRPRALRHQPREPHRWHTSPPVPALPGLKFEQAPLSTASVTFPPPAACAGGAPPLRLKSPGPVAPPRPQGRCRPARASRTRDPLRL